MGGSRFYNFFPTSLHLRVSYADILPDVMAEMPHLESPAARSHQSGIGRHDNPITGRADPLCAFLPLPYHHVLFPLGFPVHIKSNELAVVRLAEETWGRFESRFRDTPIEVRFLVSDVPVRRRPSPPVFRAQGNLLMIAADVHNFACCDLSTGFGFACVSRGTLTKREYTRNHFLAAMVYTLLDMRNVVALHAACLVMNGAGVLFVGPSGAGKSSFAYACMRRGWTYISDDASSLVRRRTGRLVVGNPDTFRFRPTASALFPELKGRVKVRNGKPTVEIKTEQLKRIKVATECTVDYILFLNRQEHEPDPARLQPLPRGEAFRRLFRENIWPNELSAHGERLDAVERLLDAHLFELTYKALDPAIDLLEQVIHRGNS